LSVAAFSSTAFQPTTTLAQETGNNTNLTSSFTGTTNGNVKPGSVSKVDVHSLLYPGATTKVFAHYNTARLNAKGAAEASPNFGFAIVEDSGSLTGAADPTTKLLSDIQYMAD